MLTPSHPPSHPPTQEAEARKLPAPGGAFEPGCGPLGGGKKAAAASEGVYALDLACQAAELEVMVLGVRNMVPMLGLPIVSPAVEAELTGVLPILRSMKLSAVTKHSSHPSGTNANFKARFALRGRKRSLSTSFAYGSCSLRR